MRNRSLYFLTELLLVLFLFALSLGLCLGLQEKSRQMAEESAEKSRAVCMAQNAAEAWKAEKDPVALARLLGGRTEGQQVVFEEGGLTACLTQGEEAGLSTLEIVVSAEGEVLFTLPVKAWKGGGSL